MEVWLFQARLDEIHRLWNLLLKRLKEKSARLQLARKLEQFFRDCDEFIFWMRDKVTYRYSPLNNPTKACFSFPGNIRSLG